MCYGWRLPSGLPVHCVCGRDFSVDHALNCPTGWYPAFNLRHNELRDFTAEILSEVCADCTEPSLQPLSGETMTYATANVEDGARLNISAAGFWGGRHQKAYSDVKVFNPVVRGHRLLLCIASLRKINEGSMSRGFERLIWLHLHL